MKRRSHNLKELYACPLVSDTGKRRGSACVNAANLENALTGEQR
jgi:hypothetical protein